jgi:hypothetical protein
MKIDDLENELRNLKYTHLTESEMADYCDQVLDAVGRARAEAHLKQCFICERQLELLREESAALSNRVITPDDIVLVERGMEQIGLPQKPPGGKPLEIAQRVSMQERLGEYLQQMVANWRIHFALVRRADQGKKVWQWQSKDGHVQAWATMEKNADMIIHFSSNEIDLEGERLNVRLGQLNQEVTLQRVSESEVYAKIAVPWQYRQGKMADISIESI